MAHPRKKLDRWQRGAKYRLQLLAELASVSSLTELSRKEKQKLVTLARKSAPLGLHTPEGSFLDGWTEECAHAWGQPDPPLAWVAIWNTHQLAYETLHRFFNGSPVNLSPLQQFETQWQYDRECEAGQPRFDTAPPGVTLLAELATIIRNPSFPLRRCPWCKTQVFVRRGKRKYCKLSCTNKANEDARKDDPKRKADVKNNMQRYRDEKQKAQKTAQEKPLAGPVAGLGRGKGRN